MAGLLWHRNGLGVLVSQMLIVNYGSRLPVMRIGYVTFSQYAWSRKVAEWGSGSRPRALVLWQSIRA
jgi:hypothetical protein